MNREQIAHLQPCQEILAQIEGEPRLIEIDDREQRRTGADIFVQLDQARGNLAAQRCVDRQLVKIGLTLGKRGLGLRDLCGRHGAFFGRSTGTGQIKLGLGGLDTTRGIIDIAHGLADCGLRAQTALPQFRVPRHLFFGQSQIGLCCGQFRLTGADHFGPCRARSRL
ncbi:hypothetical protein GCM10008966_34830 [Rhodovulum strictum]